MKKLIHFLCLWVFVFSANASDVEPDIIPGSDAVFVRNDGQIIDMDGQVRNEFLYYLPGSDIDIYFRENGITYIIKESEYPYSMLNALPEAIEDSIKKFKSGNIYFYRFDMDFVDNNEAGEIEGRGGDGFYNNYYLAHCPDGILNVPLFSEVRYNDVYQGVDISFYLKDGQLKYDIIVDEGADLSVVKFYFNGPENVFLENNELHLTLPKGDWVETLPESYYLDGGKNKATDVSYVLKDNILSFQVESDGNGALYIDPVVTWTTYYDDCFWNGGGSNLDIKGNQFVIVSYGFSALFPLLNPGGGAYYQSAVAGSGDYRILKFDANGVRIWATYYGGTGYDHSPDVSIDHNGNIYVCGHTESTNIPVSSAGGYYDASYTAGTYSGGTVILRFNSSGARTWGTHYDYVHYPMITVDYSNNVYVVGRSEYDNPPVQFLSGAYNQSTVANSASGTSKSDDIFIMKFNSSTSRLWATNLGGSSDEFAQDLVVSPDNYLNIVGYGDNYYGTGIITRNPGGGAHYDNTLGIGTGGSSTDRDDALIYRFTPGGFLYWGTAFSGTLAENMQQAAITADASNNIYIYGETRSTNLPVLNPGGGAYYDGTFNASSSGFNPFLARFSPGGVRNWCTYFGTNGLGFGMNFSNSLNVNADGNLVAVLTDNGGVGGCHPQVSRTGDYNASSLVYMCVYIAEFDANLGLDWATYYGGTKNRHTLGDAGVSQDGCGYQLFMTSNWEMYDAAATDPPWEKPIATSYQDQTWLTTGNRSGLITRFSYRPVDPGPITGEANLCAGQSGEVYSVPNIPGVTFTWTVPSGSSIVSGQGTNSIVVNFGSTNGQICVTAAGGCVNPGPVCFTITFPTPGGTGLWTWLGGVSTNWFDPCNWDKKTVPTISADVLIPGGTPNEPLINGAGGECKSIEIVSTNGAELTINVTGGGNLEVAD